MNVSVKMILGVQLKSYLKTLDTEGTEDDSLYTEIQSLDKKFLDATQLWEDIQR